MDEQTPHLLGAENSQTPHLLGGDIVYRLLHMAWTSPEGEPYADALTEAADEIQRLRVALALVCNELFGVCDPLETSPHKLMAHFLEEAT